MLREKLFATIVVAAGIVSAVMLIDFVLCIAVLHDPRSYTPLITLAISVTVALPASFAILSGRIDLRQAHDELAVARDAALELSRVKSEFLANMSHELRTPLNAILGFSEVLQSDLFAAHRVEYAVLIHSSGKHLLSLVNDLLDLSRIEARKLELHNDAIEPGALIEYCLATTAPLAAEGQIVMVRRLDERILALNADSRALRQILLNLLNNAIKFTGPGKSIAVETEIDHTGRIVFSVRDEGTGIADDEQEYVFNRFGQSRHDVNRSRKGSGLGLPIVKGLAEAHGGGVALQSRLGVGTSVSVWFPAERTVRRCEIASNSAPPKIRVA